MRKALLALALVATPAAAASDVVMYRDPGCGCCEAWAAQVKKAFGGKVRVIDAARRDALRKGLPAQLASCHTAIIDGMVFEGHVPIADMRRVLAERPKGVRGLAAGGMPLGSPGMEVPGGARQPYTVVAFGTGAPRVYARH